MISLLGLEGRSVLFGGLKTVTLLQGQRLLDVPDKLRQVSDLVGGSEHLKLGGVKLPTAGLAGSLLSYSLDELAVGAADHVIRLEAQRWPRNPTGQRNAPSSSTILSRKD
jgi:hypothetical protein